MVPVSTMAEVPVISDAERDELIASLKEGQARIAAGEYTVHNPDTFVEHLMELRAAALRRKTL